MTIFKAYTGNAMLNNAIMIVLCLAGKKDLSELTSHLLKTLLYRYDLTADNKRFKSYTMLFTRNGPLFNDELGDMLYKGLLNKIVDNIETEGCFQCDVSGLKFNSSFEDLFKEMLIESGYVDKKFKLQDQKERTKKTYKEKTPEQIEKQKQKILEDKDLSINRMWFPLIGGLGSDAQALPQAKYNYTIHPLCVLLMQFMPYGTVLYKGGVLLVDSCNYNFALDYIRQNVAAVKKESELHSTANSIENIRPETGHYIIQALKTLQEKEEYYDEYVDLNLWSFSNSGTGASCSIDRIPDNTLKKLMMFYKNPKTLNDLSKLLYGKYGSSFIEYLTDENDFYGLYPAKGWEGIGVDFYDLYQQLIYNKEKIVYAKYIAGLVRETNKLPKEFEKLIDKSDAYRDPNFRSVINKVLIDASANGKWNIMNHIEILDSIEEIPLNSNMYKIFRMIHYYYKKDISDTKLPNLEFKYKKIHHIIGLLVYLINNHNKDIRSEFVREENSRISYLKRVLINYSNKLEIQFVLNLLYKENYMLGVFGLFDLLRIYYSNSTNQSVLPYNDIDGIQHPNFSIEPMTSFCDKYFQYYCDKYRGEDKLPLDKFREHVLKPMPRFSGDFYNWFESRKDNMEEAGVDVSTCDYIRLDGDVRSDMSLFVTTYELTKRYLNNL